MTDKVLTTPLQDYVINLVLAATESAVLLKAASVLEGLTAAAAPPVVPPAKPARRSSKRVPAGLTTVVNAYYNLVGREGALEEEARVALREAGDINDNIEVAAIRSILKKNTAVYVNLPNGRWVKKRFLKGSPTRVA
jgi:hypothetical protein